MTDALSYNREQGFAAAEVAFIQRRVGAVADGRWGPNTLAAIARWQGEAGLAADAKVRRSLAGDTWPRLLEAGAADWSRGTDGAPGISRVGLWTFRDALEPDGAEAAEALELAKAAKLTDVIFTITNDSDTSFALPRSVADIVTVGRRFKDAGIDVGLNTFIFPSVEYVDALVDAVVDLDQRLGLRRLDLDAEELWIKQEGGHEAAAARLGQGLAAARPGFFTAVNGIVYTSHAALDPLVRQAAVTHVTPQAYSTANHRSADGSLSPTYNPIDLQATAADKWGGWWPEAEMIGGFATYNQGGRYELGGTSGELSETLALGLALRAWADHGVAEVTGWSIKTLSPAAVAVLARRVSPSSG